MSRYDFSAQRLYLPAALAAGARLSLDRDKSNYLLNVLRLSEGAGVLVFNGVDGEWLARLEGGSRKQAVLRLESLAREQTRAGDLHYCFAPVKHARLDYMVQKAVEMGACALRPVITRRTQAARVNLERMNANAIEAAEQCGILHLPAVHEPQTLTHMLETWPADRMLVFCDEDEPAGDPVAALRARVNASAVSAAVLIGPEGGFDPQ
ncbi:MAG: 16S rRNA (uracil(1498)-N(3))-methyltransferase, partial [Alphaproteobacteria bacterium]|nr:16S rRNA (uracil(1498)-N(3))-methyltransferase [Alphaproteobacteria bacterium]